MHRLEEKDRHRMLWHGRCYFCICRVCNRARCRYKSRDSRCWSCLQMGKSATLDCDQFESRYVRKIYRIKRDLLKGNPSVAQMIRDMWEAGNWK